MLETETFLHPWTGHVDAPLRLVENVVRPAWVDEYSHMNMAHYLTVCDQANWAFFNWINDPMRMEARNGHEYVIVENHVTYCGELAEGCAFAIETQLLAHDAKCYILFHRVLDGSGQVAATNEVKMLGFNLRTRRPDPWGNTPARASRLSRTHIAACLLRPRVRTRSLSKPEDHGRSECDR
ncbi:thioesterase family protein [Sagittula stellata]|uniref:Uncharacterized protein n=1 Tax=Sagittula stellata (strain ATCC 700073 / DSM 11524 / E-37) TaxID=388399 RepID=A3K4X4_SAGS3|nr:thioesterase family protein [Sagittula stellata]EBA07575.1 hypothetical protein SSE37_13353 [Sagittula stellata E-37]